MKNVYVYDGELSDGVKVFTTAKRALNFIRRYANFTYDSGRRSSIPTYAHTLRSIKSEGVASWLDVDDRYHNIIKREIDRNDY